MKHATTLSHSLQNPHQVLPKFLHQLMHKFFKRSIKIYIKTAPTYFSVITILQEHTI